MMEYRVRTRRSNEWASERKGKQVNPEMVQLLLVNECRILRPDGKPLCVYLPGAVKDLSEAMFPEFSTIRVATTNRGAASGSPRVKRHEFATQTHSAPVLSTILGSIDMDRVVKKETVCRLTSFNAEQVEKWDRLMPMFQRIAQKLEEYVPERFALQAQQAARTNSDWIISGTPFTTITVNNTYPTGIHTDKGDLDAGFSTLAVMRRGEYTGGWLTFPQYGVAADMQDGDLLLMDAHDWHGNTPMLCSVCGESLRMPDHECPELGTRYPLPPSPERVSIVSYFRTQIAECGSLDEENAKRAMYRDERSMKAFGLGSAQT